MLGLDKEACKVTCPHCKSLSCVRCNLLYHGMLSCKEVQDMEAEVSTAKGCLAG